MTLALLEAENISALSREITGLLERRVRFTAGLVLVNDALISSTGLITTNIARTSSLHLLRKSQRDPNSFRLMT